VGRIAPNKCIEELITAFAWFHRNIEPQSRLLIVGSERSAPSYYTMLKMYAAELELDTVFFERFASPAGLSAYYQIADLFATPSRHEGYCLPLVEAMHKGVPVIARRTGGTPEAMGNAGILVDEFRPEELAELFGMLCHDPSLRETVLASQRQRMDQVLNRPVREEFQALLANVLPA
jgi:glycosyltransferase involved in cell wall biosynthesis